MPKLYIKVDEANQLFPMILTAMSFSNGYLHKRPLFCSNQNSEHTT